MSKEDWVCVVLMILGIVLFLVGANVWNAVVGWAGVFLFLVGLVALIVFYVYNKLASSPVQNP